MWLSVIQLRSEGTKLLEVTRYRIAILEIFSYIPWIYCDQLQDIKKKSHKIYRIFDVYPKAIHYINLSFL